MLLETPTGINRDEWLRRLQAKESGDEAGRRLAEQMDWAEEKLLEILRPRGVYRLLQRQEVPAEGISIEKHLEGCERVALFAVTCGSRVDELIHRTQVTDIATAVICDAGASVLADQLADEAEQIIRKEISMVSENAPDSSEIPTEGEFYFTPRFSPGYGDYPLSYQRKVLDLVDAGRKIGLKLTENDLMIPQKSVTALMGIADHPVKGRLATCGECILQEKCEYYKRGEHC